MESATQTIWLVGAATLVIGIVIGLLIARSSNQARSKEALIEELNDARRELEDYKIEVSTHFGQTADLVNKLTDSYRDVHQHLSNSARELCNDEQLLASLEHKPEPEKEATEAEQDQSPVEPPRDYAPKTDPGAEGTLSEDYGLKPEAELHDPSRIADHSPHKGQLAKES